MIEVKPHYALVARDGMIYGGTVYTSLKEASKAMSWTRKNLDSKLSLVELKAKEWK